MSLNLHSDFRQGSYRDLVSRNVQTNSGTKIVQDSKGRCVRFSGAEYIDTGLIANDIFTSSFSLEIWVKFDDGDPSTFETFFGVFDDAVDNRVMCRLSTSQKIQVLFEVDGNLVTTLGGTVLPDGQVDWLHIFIIADATIQGVGGIALYLDNVLDGTGDTTSVDFSTYNTGSQTIYVGASNKETPPATLHMNGLVGGYRAFTHVLSSAERTRYYNQFLALTHITKPIVIKRGDATDMIVSLDGTNWNADGGTTNASLGNLEIATGAFRCLEDATGKYIECTTNGTLILSGIDLSIFTGNGYLKEVLGDLSGDQGGTVDAASAFAFSSNVLTITMTAAQKLRGLTITASA